MSGSGASGLALGLGLGGCLGLGLLLHPLHDRLPVGPGVGLEDGLGVDGVHGEERIGLGDAGLTRGRR